MLEYSQTIQHSINKLRQQLNFAYSDGNLSALTHNKLVWTLNELEQLLREAEVLDMKGR